MIKIAFRPISYVNIVFISYIVLLIYFILPHRFASHYSSISRNEILDNLLEKTTKNLTLLPGKKCNYDDIINDNSFMYTDSFNKELLSETNILVGGEYYPTDCAPLYSTAIIIPYRNREKQLNQFLIYMHNFLRKQKIHYRIFIAEQYDKKPFNRAKLFNIGAVAAIKFDFPCLIFHDVDLMPMNLGHLYACTRKPRHMCSSLDIFRFNLPYTGLFGGVVSIDTKTFKFINGMSNLFQGWGGEDDDLFSRLKAKNIEICRFEPLYSHYTMLKHAKEKPNEDRVAFLRNGHFRFNSDGLNSLIYEEKSFTLEKLYTRILVET